MSRPSSALFLGVLLSASALLAGCAQPEAKPEGSSSAFDEWRDLQTGRDPNCSRCGPEDDLDGDGVSNKDEVDQSRNPNCDENLHGTEFCAGLDPAALPPTEPVENRTFGAPPKYRLGEWWKVRVTANFTPDTYETTRVVAGVEGESYLIGMPVEAFSNPLMVLHIPGFGQVSRDDLSFEIHDALFEPLKFPLEPGMSWNTAFEGRPVEVTVQSMDASKAVIEVWNEDGQSDHMTLTYDLALGDFSTMALDNYGTVEILEHGYDYNGTVTVPHVHDVVFLHGRSAGVLGPGLVPAAPQDVVTVDPTYDRVSFANIIIGTTAQNSGGVCRETATAPDGTEFVSEMTPADPGFIKVEFFMVDQPEGDWTFDHFAGGACQVLAEGIAYHVYDVELPSGRVLPSKGQHDHGA